MLVSISWMKENYNKYNNMYFNNVLPEIDFKISRSKQTWGYAEYRYKLSLNKITPTSITMSNYYDSPEEVKLTTLLHEMIHIYDYTINPHHFVKNGRKVRYDAHGYWFKNECLRLKKFGWDIEKYVTAEEKACSEMSDNAKRLQQNKENDALICVISGSNGYNWFIKTNTWHVKEILTSISNCYWSSTLGKVTKISFYKFDNPTLAAKRSAGKKIRGWRYSNEKLNDRLKEIKAKKFEVKNTKYYIERIAA